MKITLLKCVGLFRKRELHKWDSLDIWSQGVKVELIKSDSKLQDILMCCLKYQWWRTPRVQCLL